MKGKLTIVMIAHRLSTIATADNLLLLESPSRQIVATKGTPEYEEIMQKLKMHNYAHQMDDAEAEVHFKQKSAKQSKLLN